ALGPARRHPAFGAHQQASLPPAHLFLRRYGPLPRRHRQAHRRLGRRRKVVGRSRPRQSRAPLGAAGDGGGRACGQARQRGPRPHAAPAKARDRFYDEVVDGYFARHRVKPGVTGWAQINGWRGETDTEEKIARRVEHDLFYIENWSVFFDLYILMMTPIRL